MNRVARLRTAFGAGTVRALLLGANLGAQPRSYLARPEGLELEPFCGREGVTAGDEREPAGEILSAAEGSSGRERSGSPQAKS